MRLPWLRAVGVALLCAMLTVLSSGVSRAATTPVFQSAPANGGILSPSFPNQSLTSSPSGISLSPSRNIGQVGDRTPNDKVEAQIEIGSTIYACGEFSRWVWNGKSYPRLNCVSFDATTGQPNSWNPKVNGEVSSIARSATGTLVYLAGAFTSVNGASRKYAAKVSASTGALDPWHPLPNGKVTGVQLLDWHTVLTGDFTSINGVARTQIASISATGTPDSWLNLTVSGHETPGYQGVHKVVENHAHSLAVMIGNFNTVNGVTHRRIAELGISGSSVVLEPWNTTWTAVTSNHQGTDCSPGYNDPERDVTWLPNDSFFATAATGGAQAHSVCDAVSKWSPTTTNTAVVPVVNYTGGDSVTAVACTNVSCFTSGHNRWANATLDYSKIVTPCADQPKIPNPNTGHQGYNCLSPTSVDRPGIFEVYVSSWTVTPWNPTRSRETAMQNTMMITSQGLWVGSDGLDAAGQLHNDEVQFPFGQ